jgi:NADPH-dependent curcumin reductase CurA
VYDHHKIMQSMHQHHCNACDPAQSRNTTTPTTHTHPTIPPTHPTHHLRAIMRRETSTLAVHAGLPLDEHFEIRSTQPPMASSLKEGEMLVVVRCMSADPYLRGGCKSEAKGGAVPRPMSGFVVATVAASRRDGWSAGELLCGSLPFSTVQVVPASSKGPFWKIDQHVGLNKASLGLGLLGMPGSTA